MGSFRRWIRIFRSQDAKFESRPSLCRKTYPIQIYVLIVVFSLLVFLSVQGVILCIDPRACERRVTQATQQRSTTRSIVALPNSMNIGASLIPAFPAVAGSRQALTGSPPAHPPGGVPPQKKEYIRLVRIFP